ncbi:MAG: AI-2E family transporter [Akkermansia sp.]|nr:AI-2E family transporter [Akkermansia sp.]
MQTTGEENTAKNTQTEGWGEGARFLLTAACALIILFGLREARDLLLPIVMAIFLAVISYSMTDILRRWLRFPHWLAVFFTVVADAGLIYAAGSLIKFLAADMKNTFEGVFMTQMQEKYQSIMAFLNEWGYGAEAQQFIHNPQEYINPKIILSLSQSLGSQVISMTSVTTLVLILMTFLLGEAPLFMRNFRSLPNSVQGKSKVIDALKSIQRYLFIKTIASATTGLLAWWLCHSMNVPFAFLWGLVAFLLNYIPTIGSIVAAIPPILLGLILGDLGDGVVVALGYVIINFAIGNGIEPLFLGKQFGIATSVVLLSVLLWGWVWGPCGMLLAVPITVMLKLALENSRDLYWVAAIIDDNSTPSSEDSKK